MKFSLAVMAGLAVLLTVLAWHRGPEVAGQGVRNGLLMLAKIGPVLVPAFLRAGMMQALVPQQTLSGWLGADSGLRGIIIGTAVGAVQIAGIIALVIMKMAFVLFYLPLRGLVRLLPDIVTTRPQCARYIPNLSTQYRTTLSVFSAAIPV